MKKQDDSYSDEETVRRRDEAIKRMLNTPPRPRRPKREPKEKEKEEPAKKAWSKPPS